MNTWNALAESVVDWLLSTSWQAAILAFLVVIVQLGFRRMLSARWCYFLWLLVVGRLLIPSLPESPTSLYRYIPASPVATIREEPLISPVVTLRPIGIAPASALNQARETPTTAAVTPMSTKGILMAVWLAGFLALAVSLIECNLRFRRAVLAGCRPTDKETRELAELLAREMGVTRRFDLMEAVSLDTPAVVGVFSPKLLLPRNFAVRLSRVERALIFRHELAHLRRGDLWINMLVCILQIVHWFNPMLWWAFSRMRHDRELATDALALRAAIDSREAYGETLVKLAAGNQPPTSLNPAIGILEHHRSIRQRVEQIPRLKPNAYAWSALGALLLLVLALLALTKAPMLGGTRVGQGNDSDNTQFRFVVDKKDVELDARAQAHVIGEIEAVVRGAEPSSRDNAQNSFNMLTPAMIKQDGNYFCVTYPGVHSFAATKGPLQARQIYVVNYPSANLLGFPPGGIVLVGGDGELTHAYCGSDDPLLNLSYNPEVYSHLSSEIKSNLDRTLSGDFNLNDSVTLEPPLRLIAAASAGNLAELKALLGTGVKINDVPECETTLLFSAGSPEVAEFLIAQGIDVNARDKRGFTALMSILQNERPTDDWVAPTIQVLLKHGADPNAHTEDGWSQLLLARNGPAVDVLVAAGADVHARFNGVGVLDELYAGYKQLSYFQALAAHGLQIDNHANGVYLLNWAVSEDMTDVVKWLLDRGVDPNATDPTNATFEGSYPARPMMVAAGSGSDRAAKLLIAHGGKIDDAVINLALDDQRENVLRVFHDAGSANFPELLYQVSQRAPADKIEELLKAGALADPPGGHMTPLALASRHGDLDSVKALVQYGANTNRKGAAGTPLGLAAAGGYEDVVKFLLRNGARPDLDTMDASIGGCIAQTQFYKHVGPLDPQPFYRSIQALANAGGYKSIRPEQMTAAFLNGTDSGFSIDPEIVKIQLAAGVNPESKDAKGKSALDAVEAAYARYSDTRTRAQLQQIINLFIGAKLGPR
jgi:bla regulator protein BlaR1